MPPDIFNTLRKLSQTRLGTVVLHLLAWIALVVLVSIQWSYNGGFDFAEWVERGVYLSVTFAVPVYLGLAWWTRMGARDRYGQGVAGCVVLILAWSTGAYLFFGPNLWTGREDSFRQWLGNTTFMVFLAIGLRATYRSVRRERELQALRARTAESEVANLRAQLNPHFLFNTLNNIYAAILDDGPRGAALVLELSRVMRYHYELSARPSVPLASELALVSAVVELERLRLSSLTEVRVSLPPEAVVERYAIPPLLLVPLVENAFKHGTHSAKAGLVEVAVSVAGSRLTFAVVNPVHEHLNTVSTGVGLVNLRERLRLLYGGGDFTFVTGRDGAHWRARLEIPVDAATAPAPRVLATAELPSSTAEHA